MNISLIGMSGAGKSFIGKRVAGKLGLRCVDIDDEMEKQHGKLLPQLIDEWGDDRFIAEETKTVDAFTYGKDGLLISTGGSIVYSDEAMRLLRATSLVIYLRVPRALILERIVGVGDRSKRIIQLGNKSLDELMAEREPLYERYAHHVLDTEPLSADETVDAVAAIAAK
ncbi:AAA family ATPase [Candidatus Kaiserbacteria bacterium]|nr:AAA family ATPase [Candidatus Kaiserbacteria bacterium]